MCVSLEFLSPTLHSSPSTSFRKDPFGVFIYERQVTGRAREEVRCSQSEISSVAGVFDEAGLQEAAGSDFLE